MNGRRFVRPQLVHLCDKAPRKEANKLLWRMDSNERGEPVPMQTPVADVPLERYPDASYTSLRHAFSALLQVPAGALVVGNGSDELIDLLIRVTCTPGVDRIVVFEPSFEMYTHWAELTGVAVVRVPLADDFALDAVAIAAAVAARPKLVFVCTPNNPTGNTLDVDALISALGRQALVVVDEAYADFAEPELRSRIPDVAGRDDLVVLRTLSKAWGLAALRVGVSCAPAAITAALDAARAPFNVSALSARLAEQNLRRPRPSLAGVAEERARVSEALSNSPFVAHVYPSVANFILFACHDRDAAVAALQAAGIAARVFGTRPRLLTHMRITVGAPHDNDKALRALAAPVALAPQKPRAARVERTTKETRVRVCLQLDGSGKSRISTGVRFFDHMLEQLGKHAGVDLDVQATGDLDIDVHHIVEDVAIAIGTAFLRALGEAKGLERYGFVLPMDETLVTVAIDIGGRAFCACELPLRADKVGDLPTALVPHIFRSFAFALGATLHLKGSGSDDHHLVEAAFKGLARSLKQAVRKDPGAADAPVSTKGAVAIT